MVKFLCMFLTLSPLKMYILLLFPLLLLMLKRAMAKFPEFKVRDAAPMPSSTMAYLFS